jgi:D-glucosaminate-6-phosphate ammonia-lyase
MQTATAPAIYEQLGVKPVINARGHNTVLGGSTPSPRVRQAMEDAERYYVVMQDLLRATGETIASYIGAEAAYVTSGAAAALALGTAACITGNDMDKVARLPDTTGLKNKVLIQARQHYAYEHATTIVGTRLIEVGSAAEGTTAPQLEAALTPDVATVLYPAHLEGQEGCLSLREVLQLAHGKGIPVLVDAAGRVFPLELFKSYTAMGADLVAFGAKYIGAPNSSGILCGRKDLIEAAVPQGFIGFETVANRHSFGRPLKLDRQEIIAVAVAVQEWFETDHAARLARLEERLSTIVGRLQGAPGVTVSIVRADGPAPRVLRLVLEPGVARLDVDGVVRGLMAESPAIAVGADPGSNAVSVNVATVWEGDEEIVAERLARLLG